MCLFTYVHPWTPSHNLFLPKVNSNPFVNCICIECVSANVILAKHLSLHFLGSFTWQGGFKMKFWQCCNYSAAHSLCSCRGNCGCFGPPQAAFLFLLIKEWHISFQNVCLALIFPAVLAQVIYMQVNSLNQISQVVKHHLKNTEQHGAAGTWLHAGITSPWTHSPWPAGQVQTRLQTRYLGGEWGRSQGNVGIVQGPPLQEYGCI